MLDLYTVFHLNLAFSSIEEEQRADVIKKCYWPILELARDQGVPLGLEATGYTLEAIDAIDPEWTAALRELWRSGDVQFIGSGYAQIIGPLVPPDLTGKNLDLGHACYQKLLGQRPDVALVNEQAYAPGLVPLYLDAGYRAIIMDWADPASHHPEWDRELAYQPQQVAGTDGRAIDLIWSDAIAFQKFQRMVHGELPLDDYLGYLKNIARQGARALCFYGSDAETIDFRPGRFASEAESPDANEWQRVAALVEELKRDEDFNIVTPTEALGHIERKGKALSLESPQCPIPVKKQRKYSIARWAVTGRADLALNTACGEILEGMRSSDGVAGEVSNEDWRALCRCWASDLRTHITDKRWQAAITELSSLKARYAKSPPPDLKAIDVDSASTSTSTSSNLKPFEVSRNGHFLNIEAAGASLRLNLYRGMAIDRFSPAADGDQGPGDSSSSTPPHWLGTLEHGYYDDISWGADFYSGHLTLDLPGEHKVTDLANVEPEIRYAPDKGFVEISTEMETRLGSIRKTIRLFADAPELSIEYELADAFFAGGSLRMAHLTLNPEAFDAADLQFRSHNGGETADTHACGSSEIDHGGAISSLVSSAFGTGMTGGWLELGDGKRSVRVEHLPGCAQTLGLITKQTVGDSFFFRASLSAGETDDTRKKGDEGLVGPSPGPIKLGFMITLREN